MPAVYETGMPEPSVEEAVNEAGIRETTVRFEVPVYGALQLTWDDPRVAAAADPLIEDGYIDAFRESFDTVTLYTPEEEPVAGFVDVFVDVVASHYEPPERMELERSGRTALYKGYAWDGGTVVDVRFDDAVPVVPRLVTRDEQFQEDVASLTETVPFLVTADDSDALQDGVFHLYAGVHPANLEAYMDAYLDRVDEWLYAFDL